MINSVIMDEKDSVVTVTKAVYKGDIINYKLNDKIIDIKANADIPINHKVAVKNIKKGELILKYGEKIGYAISDINIGDYVHIHNLDSEKPEV